MISIKNLTKEFSGQKVLDGIDIDIEKGEVVALVGASGAGKSTILRSLNYLEQPDSGTITIDDFKVDFKTITKEQILTLRRKLAMVFQQFNLFERRTALDNVKEGLKIVKKLSDEEATKIAKEELAKVGLSNRENHYPRHLSGGQKQRVAIAGVVALRPAILILDEATSMLDPEGRRELIETVKGIRKDYDMTVISITHDLEEVAMSDRVLVMKKGKIESTSSPRELFSRNDLDQIGLDDPFANQLKHSLNQNGYNLPENYLTESELEDKLWELL